MRTIVTAIGLAVLSAVRAETEVPLPAVPARIMTHANEAAGTPERFRLNTDPLVRMTPGDNELIPIALGHLNRLVTPFDHPFVHTSSSEQQAKIDYKNNVLYVSTQQTNPITLFITSQADEGMALSLTLVPRNIPPREVKLALKEGYRARLRKVAADAQPAQNLPHIERIKALFRDLALQRIPAGYELRRPAPGERIVCAQPGAEVRLGQVLEGARWRVWVGVLKNTGQSALELREAACRAGSGDIVAVTGWPDVHLAPNGEAEVYVATRPPENRAETDRPTLLEGSP